MHLETQKIFTVPFFLLRAGFRRERFVHRLLDVLLHFPDFLLDEVDLLPQPDVRTVVTERVDEGVVDGVL